MSKVLWTTLFTIALCTVTLGQDLDMDCRPIQLPQQCITIAAELERVESRYEHHIGALRQLLFRAASSDRTHLLEMIREIELERDSDPDIIRLADELRRCKLQFDMTPRRTIAPSVLNAIFKGTVATRTSNSLATGPFFQNVTLGLQFSRNRCNVTITSFPPIIFNAGPANVTVTMTGGGTGQFFPVTGHMNMPLDLLFANSGPFTNSTATTDLTTGSAVSDRGTFSSNGTAITGGQGVENCGRNGTNPCFFSLVGMTVLQDGILGGSEAQLTVFGNITIPDVVRPTASEARQECLAGCDEEYLFCMERRGDGLTPTMCAVARNKCKEKCPAR